MQTVFPFLDFFGNISKAEWTLPGSHNSLASIANKFHALPYKIMEELKVPLVGALVGALHSGVVLPKDSENALKDSVDRMRRH